MASTLTTTGAIHAVTNVGEGDATELATYFAEKGQPLLVVAP